MQKVFWKKSKKENKKIMSIQINIATADDISEIDQCNRAVLPENYPRDFYDSLFASPHCCNFVVKYSDQVLPQEKEKTTEETKASAPQTTEASAPQTEDTVITKDNVTLSEKSIPDAKLAGYILSAVQSDAKGQMVAHVLSLAVYEEYRRKQIATILMRCVETMMKQKYPELKYIVLHMRKHNKPGYNFYTKNGFSRAGMEKSYYKTANDLATKFKVKTTEDAYVMKKYF